MVTPSFYYVFNISLSCNINMPSFIGNLWWDLLLGNHLKKAQCVSNRCKDLFKRKKYFGVRCTLKSSMKCSNVRWYKCRCFFSPSCMKSCFQLFIAAVTHSFTHPNRSSWGHIRPPRHYFSSHGFRPTVCRFPSGVHLGGKLRDGVVTI